MFPGFDGERRCGCGESEGRPFTSPIKGPFVGSRRGNWICTSSEGGLAPQLAVISPLPWMERIYGETGVLSPAATAEEPTREVPPGCCSSAESI